MTLMGKVGAAWRAMAASRWGRVWVTLRSGIRTDNRTLRLDAPGGRGGRWRARTQPTSQGANSDTASQPIPQPVPPVAFCLAERSVHSGIRRTSPPCPRTHRW